MVYPIVKWPAPVLLTSAATVIEFGTPELQKLLADMFESMYAANGVGLAAPQIGVSQRIAVIDCSVGEDPGQKLVLINPVVLHTEGKQQSEEGCLSLPGFRFELARANVATIRAQDADGNWYQRTGTELLARAFLHEIDHLHGRLFISHVSRLKRDLVRRRVAKLQKTGEW
jgi:peptide deformylase